MANLRKGLSLGGAGWQYESTFPPSAPQYYYQNDFRLGNILAIFDYNRAQPSKWVKVWIDMRMLFENSSYVPPAPNPADPSAYKSLWNFMTYDPTISTRFRNLDAQIKAANDRGCAVILTLYHSLPKWASADYSNDSATQYPDINQNPSRWGWFLAYLYARYRVGAAVNSPGPRDANQYGNPSGASLYGIEPLNEPNQLLSPNFTVGSNPQPIYLNFVTKCITYADACSAFWGGPQGPYTFAPAVADITDQYPNHKTVTPGQQEDYQRFTVAVMNDLRNYRFQKYVGWSIHAYRDTKYYDAPASTQPTNLSSRFAVLSMQTYNWKQGTDLNVYITEAGLNLTNIDADQRQNGSSSPLAAPGVDAQNGHTVSGMNRQYYAVANHYTRVLNDGYAFCYLNHSANDAREPTFQSGLRGKYGDASSPNGEDRFLLTTWLDFTANPGAY